MIEHLTVPAKGKMPVTVIHYFFQYPNNYAVSLFRSLVKQLFQALLDLNLSCPRETIEYLELCFGPNNRTQDCRELVDHLIAPPFADWKPSSAALVGWRTAAMMNDSRSGQVWRDFRNGRSSSFCSLEETM